MQPKKKHIVWCLLLVRMVHPSFAGARGTVRYFNVFFSADTTIVSCGTSATLNTTPVAGYSNPTWNNGSTGTSMTVNATGDYWWQVTGSNIVTNGDFSAPKTSTATRGFSSAYTYMDVTSTCSGCCCGVLSSEGVYAVNTNPHNLHTSFSSFGDHTTGTGNMLVVNGASVANITVWSQNIPVLPNTNYVFSVWVTSAYPANPAALQFSINGSPLGSTITPSSTTGLWQYFTATWNSGSNSGTLPIALVNQNTIANGNDFAVDDIVFAPVYRQNIHVTLNPIPVLTLDGAHTACGSFDLTKTIVGYDPATDYYFFKDSGGNNIPLANAQLISQTGTYTISGQNKATGCASLPKQTTITINPNPQKPAITSSL